MKITICLSALWWNKQKKSREAFQSLLRSVIVGTLLLLLSSRRPRRSLPVGSLGTLLARDIEFYFSIVFLWYLSKVENK